MNLLLRSLAVGTLLTAATAFAADAFEGKVSFTLTGAKGPQAMDFTLKDQVQRIDTNAGGHNASVIFDLAKHQMTALIHDQHMFVTMPLQVPAQVAAKAQEMAGNADVQKDGKTETILGYPCQHLVITDKAKGTTTEVWLADGLGTFMGLGSGGGNPFAGGGRGAPPSKWEEALKGVGGFPLRVITHGNGKDAFKMEATKIEPGPQPDSAFAPPAGYTNPMANMPAGMSPFGH